MTGDVAKETSPFVNKSLTQAHPVSHIFHLKPIPLLLRMKIWIQGIFIPTGVYDLLK